MVRKVNLVAAAAVLLLFFVSTCNAQLLFDQSITPIFGSGNTDVGWTTNDPSDNAGGMQLGLRAKVRFNDMNQPENVFNSNGDGTYNHEAGVPMPGFGFQPNDPATARWNFEFSINTGAGNVLDDFTYRIDIDFDPGVGTNFLSFDLINDLPTSPPSPIDYYDHAIGTAATGNGGGTVATDQANYLALIAGNQVAQNSWNMQFFDNAPTFPFDGAVDGQYTFVLTAFSGGMTTVTSTSIDVIVGDGAMIGTE